LEQIAPGSYDFTWDGTMNTGYYGYYEGPPYGEEPSNIAPAGLYVFDIEVIGVAPGYDEDCLRSRTLWIGEHEVYLLAHPLEAQVSFKTPFNDTIRAFYLLHDNVSASSVLIETYDPNFALIASVSGTTKTIPESTTPSAEDWNVVDFSASLTEPTAYLPYFFVFWAWDGHSSYYKSHRPKTAFINTRRLKRSVPSQKPVLLSSPSCQFLSPPSTLFLSNLGSRKVGGINWRGKYPQAALFGIHDAIMKGLLTCPSKELMEVQWMIVNVWWQWEIRKVRYANFWEYKDDDGRWRKADMIQLYGFADGLYRGVGKSLIFKALE